MTPTKISSLNPNCTITRVPENSAAGAFQGVEGAMAIFFANRWRRLKTHEFTSWNQRFWGDV
jgi:hypothetical protein